MSDTSSSTGSKPTRFSLPRWHDLHVHLRQGGGLSAYVKAQLDMGCVGSLAMPNTKPPVTRVHDRDEGSGWSIEDYRGQILAAGGDAFDKLIVPLYLSAETTPQMIEAGAKSGMLEACKYYPPHGTTNSDHGRPAQHFIDNGVFAAMADNGVVLCTHGEEHGLEGADFFDKHANAESRFYTETMPRIVDGAPNLKVVAEHITTKAAVDFVNGASDLVAATITPQHLMFTVGDLLQGLKYHLYCMPVLKFDEDRTALMQAATDSHNTRFFAGTDSAPHVKKATACGCAAGCFTGGIAPQLYAMAFEEFGVNLSDTESQRIFTEFLSLIGPRYYGFKPSTQQMTLTKTPSAVAPLETEDGSIVPLPLGLGQSEIPWSLTLD